MSLSLATADSGKALFCMPEYERQDAQLLFRLSQWVSNTQACCVVDFSNELRRSRDQGGNWLIGPAESPADAAI